MLKCLEAHWVDIMSPMWGFGHMGYLTCELFFPDSSIVRQVLNKWDAEQVGRGTTKILYYSFSPTIYENFKSVFLLI